MSICAICVECIVGEPRIFEGMTICVACDEVEILTATPERYQRGYDNDGGIGRPFCDEFNAAADRLIPERLRKLTDDVARGVPSAQSTSEYDSRSPFNRR